MAAGSLVALLWNQTSTRCLARQNGVSSSFSVTTGTIGRSANPNVDDVPRVMAMMRFTTTPRKRRFKYRALHNLRNIEKSPALSRVAGYVTA